MDKKENQLQLLVPNEVCEILRISKQSFYKRVWSGQIPSIKIGSSLRVNKDDLMDYLKNNTRNIN